MVVRLHLTRALGLAAALTLAASSAALADTNESSNWAGYAVHRSGVRFTKVLGSWRQPRASCPAGGTSYSATWIGLGGYSMNSDALEQIGTEVDCSASGIPSYSAWYELVPADSQGISMRVRAGDQIRAGVAVTGQRVVVTLTDVSTRHSFQKTLYTSWIDVTSAEWIEEAPSECYSDNTCQTLPLADFGNVTFGTARAQTTAGHAGSISDPGWGATRIMLVPGGQQFVGYGTPTDGAATPSSLRQRGSSFNVRFSASHGVSAARDAALAHSGGHLQPGGARR